MTNMMDAAQAQLREMLLAALGRLTAEGTISSEPIPAFKIEVPADKSHGDFASNIAMASAKALHKAPRQIAELLIGALDFSGSYFTRAEIAGPGFMNFFLEQKWFSETVEAVLNEGNEYGKSGDGKGKRALVEFVSANPTGPMHVGNARGAALGDGIAALLEWTGWDTQREFYVNDAGNQVEKFGKSLSLRYMQICGEKGQVVYTAHADDPETIANAMYGEDGNHPDFPMPEDVYLGRDIIIHAANYYKEHGDALASLSEEERRAALVGYALPLNIAGLERDLRSYRVEYDNWFHESSVHADGRVDGIIDELTRRGFTYEQEGAVWFKAEQFGADKDFVLRRANGIPTYIVPDIAYHIDKLVTRGYDKAINVLGADHHGYVPRLKAALKALDVDTDKLDVVLMQMVMLFRNGQPAKLSKRSGKAIGLVTLLEDIPLDAARFFFNMREANSHFEFDLDLAVEQSSKNPVYYVQYAHARICSILRNLKSEGLYAEGTPISELPGAQTSQEIELIRYLAEFPMIVSAAAKAYDPSRMTKYATELATLFHKFYDACSVKNAETPELREFRTDLCRAVAQTLRNSMSILKIDCPERM
ncbi:MAG: arginine--tRNA ligase [Oscillospiraceae bacterium]|nr:arginine--tRNA ligase [Oscillospiraceae bacterium]